MRAPLVRGPAEGVGANCELRTANCELMDREINMNMEENNYRIPRMENYRMRKSNDARFMVQITMVLVVLHAMTLFW